ncbi:unnamed protein product [Lactuca virosa]|uniref:Uncharacterized protein n=1 Tax=Lactuca virosa TaxID=75947 RepID=A0AAU9MKN5_9ASTR|nr:unnamed protein product [Lactuca virosa]
MLKTFEAKVVSKVCGMVRDSEIRLLEKVDHNDQNNELRVNSLTSMFRGEVNEFKHLVKERHVLFVQDVKKVREDVNLQLQELRQDMQKETSTYSNFNNGKSKLYGSAQTTEGAKRFHC